LFSATPENSWTLHSGNSFFEQDRVRHAGIEMILVKHGAEFAAAASSSSS